LLRLPEADLRAIRGGEISYVFQDPASSFNPLLTVGEQVGEAFRTHRGGSPAEVRQKALRGLEEARIRDAERVYRSYPHELSGGLKQRAMIAMALIAGPRLLVADEPTTALDVTTEAEILELLAEIRREKALTVLFITHDLPLAAAYAGRIVVMEKGRVVECMDKDGGGFRPGNAYTKRLFGVDLARSVPKQRIGA
jgi:ABC-type dipeptide/oligopeptide/nickel transport system ATPase component